MQTFPIWALPNRQTCPFHRKGDDTVGSPHRARISRFELFELTLLLKLDMQFPVEQFEATVSQSTVPYPPLNNYLSKLAQDDTVG